MAFPLSDAPSTVFDLINLVGAHHGEGIVGVFVCYLDDSDDRLSSVSTLAGYVGRLGDWRNFEAATAPIFDAYGVDILHAKDLHNTKGCFSGWTRLKKESFVRDVFDVARLCASFGISLSARKKAVREFKARHKNHASFSGHRICFSSIMTTVVFNNSLRDVIQSEGASFVVESGHRNNGEIEKAFHRDKRNPVFRGAARSLTFASKESSRALQLADFFAFYSRRYASISDRFDGKLSLPVPELYRIALDRVQHFHRTFRMPIAKRSEAELMEELRHPDWTYY